MHQSAGGIVNVDEQGTFGATALEPPVLRPVDPNQLANAVAPVPRLMHWLQSCPAIFQRSAAIIHCRTVSRAWQMP